MWLVFAIYLRLEGRRHELRAACAPGHRQAWLWLVDSLRLRASRKELGQERGSAGPDPGEGDVREVVWLSRVFRWCLSGGRAKAIEIEADARHVEILIHQLNPQKTKSLATLGVKSTSSDVGPTLPLEKHTPFRLG